MKNEFIKIKKEYNQEIKKSKKELKNIKQDRSEILKQLQTEKQKRAITNESVFLTKEQIKQLKMKNKKLMEQIKKHPMKKKQTKKVLFEYSVTIDVWDKYDKEKEDKRAILTNRRRQDWDLKEVEDVI